MRSLELNGSYPLSDEGIDAMVSRKSPGNDDFGGSGGLDDEQHSAPAAGESVVGVPQQRAISEVAVGRRISRRKR